MTDPLDPIDSAEEEEKKKGGEEEEGAASQGVANVSAGFFSLMVQRGASKELIAEVLRGWRHLAGKGLMRRVSDFVRGLVKSSHVQVEIDPNKNFNVVHDFIQETKGQEIDPPAAKPVQQVDPHNIPKL